MPRPPSLVRITALGLLAGLAAGCAAATPAPATSRCEALKGWASGSAHVLLAETLTPPASVDGVALNVPFCRVQGVARPSADSDIRFEVWLPEPAAWRGRYKQNGTGGFAGHTPRGRMAEDVGLGFASAGSNMGHDGGESAHWALGHPDKLLDWGLRAHAEVAAAAKALVQAHYGRPAQHAYFEGCSNGGRQAMLMAQRHPTLFDGIVAGAPSMFYPDMLMTLAWMTRAQVPLAGQAPLLSLPKRALIAERTLQACDALDGLRDGELTNPMACQFPLASLRCTAADGPECLTDTELRVATQVLGGPRNARGQALWAGPLPGAENEWAPGFADDGGYGRFIGHAVHGLDSPPFDWRQLNFDADHARVLQTLGPLTAAPNPDLSAFTARGGKLIQFQGWQDAIVSPQGTLNYVNARALLQAWHSVPAEEFERRLQALTPASLASTTLAQATRLQQAQRLFMLPGVGHCGCGAGPSALGGGLAAAPQLDAQHDLLQALLRWVEAGEAPASLIASRTDGPRVLRQRPVCSYPQQARYLGEGSIDSAESFRCTTPTAEQLGLSDTDVMQVRTILRPPAAVIPAEAGIQETSVVPVDSRLRGNVNAGPARQ